MKRVILSLLLFVLPGLPQLEAHAFLKRAEPSVGSTVRTSPGEVRIWFTEKIGSGSIQIVDTSNKQLDKRNARVDRTDQSLLRVSLQDRKSTRLNSSH